MFSNSLLGFALSTSVVEYEVNTSATSVCLFFHLWGHMGFSITAAAVTVTVATFDTLAFCEMKLQFSHLNWRTNVRQSYRKYSLDQKNTCAFCFSRCRTELLHQKAKKKNRDPSEKGGKFFLFYNSLRLCSLQSALKISTRDWITESFRWIMHIIFPHSLILDVVQCIRVVGRWWQWGCSPLCCACQWTIWASLLLPLAVSLLHLPDGTRLIQRCHAAHITS